MAGPSRALQSHVINESLVHIIHPVATQSLKAILERLGYLDYFGENGSRVHIVTDFSSTSKSVDENNNAAIIDNRVRAKLTPNVNPSSNKWEGNGTTVDLGNGNAIVSNTTGSNTARIPWVPNAVRDRDSAIFWDKEFDISLSEMAVGSTFTMEVNCEFRYPTVAAEFMSRIFQCLHDGDMIGYVDVQYDYPIPIEIQHTLAYLYTLRGPRPEVQNDSAIAWLKDYSEHAICVLENRNDPSKKEVAVNKNQMQAMYLVECSQDYPQPMDGEGASVTFNLTVQYARPNRMVLRYPIIVNNEFVEFDFIPTKPEYRMGEPSPIMWQNLAYTQYWQQLYMLRGTQVVHYPWWDGWEVPTDGLPWRRGHRPIAIIAFTLDDIDNEEGITTFDMVNGLPGIRLSDDVIQEIKYKRNQVLFPNDFVNITVYADDSQVGHVAWTDGYKALLDISDGRHLIVRSRRRNAVYRLVISVNEHPVNLTSRPISYQVYPSRWLDVTMPTYVQTKDGVVVKDTVYFWYNDLAKTYNSIPPEVAWVGRDIFAIKQYYHVNVLFVQEPPLASDQMAAKYEDVEKDNEATILIDEKRIGTPSGQVYCYAVNPASKNDPTVDKTYIDLGAVVTSIREKEPTKDKIYLSDVRTEIALPKTVVIEEELAPALVEPISTISSTIQSYIDSSRGRNVNNVWLATISTHKS